MRLGDSMTFDFLTVAYGPDLPLLRLQARSRHPGGVADPALRVHHVLLRERVQQPAIGRDDDRGFQPHHGYGGYSPYGYPPTTGGSSDPGTYRDPDGKKILTRICNETGGPMFEVKGKGGVDEIYKQIGDELRAQYRLGFTPSYEAASNGYHPLQLSLTNPADKKYDIQTRDGYYTGAAKPR